MHPSSNAGFEGTIVMSLLYEFTEAQGLWILAAFQPRSSQVDSDGLDGL